MKKKIKFIDLFAGMGGFRLGFEQACSNNKIETECLLTSEIKQYAIKTLKDNFIHNKIVGNICDIKSEDIPPFDILLGGFPCQPFSASGKKQGFSDTRGTLFFEIERILKDKQPFGFILENVEGLIKHDIKNKKNKIGETLKTILYKLKKLGYKVNWELLNGKDFGIPQSRKRIFIIGTKTTKISLNSFIKQEKKLFECLEKGLKTMDTKLTKKLLKHFDVKDLYGKSIKDKRGGKNNIHSWDIGIKGSCSTNQIELLNKLFKERRKKQWAKVIGIEWQDGMPLTLNQIKTFMPDNNLFGQYNIKTMLDDLVKKGYLKIEHPKKIIKQGNISKRIYDKTKPKGYNIVTGQLSFEITKILDPNNIAPTLVATDIGKIVVPDIKGLRQLTVKEGLRLFGYPDDFKMLISNKQAFDLLGNTVVVPIVKAVSEELIKQKGKYDII